MSRRRARVVPTAPPKTAVAYLRVSTTEQADDGAGLAAQRATIEAWALINGITIVAWYVDRGRSAKDMTSRPKLQRAIRDVQERLAERLVVAKLDRLTRSVLDFSAIMADARERMWNLVIIDFGVDLSTPHGEMMATMLATFAQWERRMIGIRTKEGLAVKKSEGVRLGRPRLVPDKVIKKIIKWRSDGASFQAIADKLNAKQVPTAQGGRRWYPSTVHTVVNSQDGVALATV